MTQIYAGENMELPRLEEVLKIRIRRLVKVVTKKETDRAKITNISIETRKSDAHQLQRIYRHLPKSRMYHAKWRDKPVNKSII